MPYSVILERGADGGYMAWVDELPGLMIRAPDRDALVQKIGPAIEQFHKWLRKWEERLPRRASTYRIVKEIPSPTKAADADSDLLLESDRQPLGMGHWAASERWLKHSRSELVQLLRYVDQSALEMKRIGGKRSIREHLIHIGTVEFMYAMWTFELTSTRGIDEFLRWTRALALRRMRQLAKVRDHRLTYAHWSGAPRPEPWTSRKAARRLVWHEKIHLQAIQRILAGADLNAGSRGRS